MTEPDGTAVRMRSRTSLVILAAIAFVPLGIAYTIFFYFPGLIPSGTTNEGTLINPPATAAEIGIDLPAGKWTLILPGGSQCDAVCEEKLYLARQVNIGLNKDADRVQRLFLATGMALPEQMRTHFDAEYPRMLVYFDESGASEAGLRRAAGNIPLTDVIYLADPNGYIILYYRGDQGGKPLLKDLKHLLKISKIG